VRLLRSSSQAAFGNDPAGINHQRRERQHSVAGEGRPMQKENPRGCSAHSMRDSAQVTAPGAITSMIVAVSTRPNRQIRSTCSRMPVPLVQKQKLRPVNRIN
jgi:hypothetical protein